MNKNVNKIIFNMSASQMVRDWSRDGSCILATLQIIPQENITMHIYKLTV